MSPKNEIAAPADAEHGTLYVAIEISGKSWVVGVKSPASKKIGLHSLGPRGQGRPQASDRDSACQG